MTSLIEDVALQEGFEGPEKRIEVEFEIAPPRVSTRRARSNRTSRAEILSSTTTSTTSVSPATGMRSYNREQWQSLLNKTACTILSVHSNHQWDAYLLSESSLFVSSNRVILKTCGRTLLLRGIDEIVKYGMAVGLSVKRVIYCRKNYTFPHRQLYPHRSFDEEVLYLDERFSGGQSFVVGPTTTDHWLCWLYSAKTDARPSDYLLFEVKMHDLDPEVMKVFQDNSGGSSQEATNVSGIQSIFPSMNIDGFLFEPCGYSMNGLANNVYSTIHITPEAHCSYVSYEAFFAPPFCIAEVGRVASKVLSTFKPASFTCTVISSTEVPRDWLARTVSSLCSRVGCVQHMYTCQGEMADMFIQTEMIVVDPCSASLSESQKTHLKQRLASIPRSFTIVPKTAKHIAPCTPQTTRIATTSSSPCSEATEETAAAQDCSSPLELIVCSPSPSPAHSPALTPTSSPRGSRDPCGLLHGRAEIECDFKVKPLEIADVHEELLEVS
ncbi:S-adenosylmethionine decarboxylase [Pelomyxa schiedti]|nr:S-adenosylmethionine decarboxylase [Pelomyxa schiedti]